MIDTLQRRGDATRERCKIGVRGLLAAVHRKLNKWHDENVTRTFILDINSANGVLSAVESESSIVNDRPGGRDPDEILGEILDRLDQLALPDCHKAIRIEITSVEGALSAVETEMIRHRWDV